MELSLEEAIVNSRIRQALVATQVCMQTSQQAAEFSSLGARAARAAYLARAR